MGFDDEMRRALEADAAKLSAMTGEDHQIAFLDESGPLMTTDTDTLVARLRECADCKSSEAWRRPDGGQDLCIGSMLADDAADRIEALEAEVARLQRDWDDAQGRLSGSRASLAAMTAQLTEARAGEDELAGLVARARDIFLNCSVEDGCCCCGDNMKGHAEPMSCGHVATDHGQYVADQWLTSSDPILASHDKRKEGR